jgi:hypothetical protein
MGVYLSYRILQLKRTTKNFLNYLQKNSFTELERAKKYILFEEAKSGKTKVICKENKSWLICLGLLLVLLL